MYFPSQVIERHLTLDRSQKGSDHSCSLLPEEFASLVTNVRIIERASGSSEKCFGPCEIPCYEKLGKSLIAARDLKSGTILSEGDIVLKVDHSKGIPAKNFFSVLGKILTRSVNCDQSITEDSFN